MTRERLTIEELSAMLLTAMNVLAETRSVRECMELCHEMEEGSASLLAAMRAAAEEFGRSEV